MAKYIDRQALGIGKCNPEIFDDKGYANGWNAAIDIIQSAPATDVRPVVRGQWIIDDAGAGICTACGEYVFETSTHHLCGWFPNFCPNCGADMKEGN